MSRGRVALVTAGLVLIIVLGTALGQLLALGGLMLARGVSATEAAALMRERVLLTATAGWLAALLPALWFGRRFAGLDASTLGLRGARGRAALAGGLGGGLALLLLPALLGRALGGYVANEAVLTAPSGASALLPISLTLPGLFIAAFGEEVVMRGLLLRLWQRSVGSVGALVASSLAFAAVHTTNPGASAAGLLGVALAGVLLGTIVLLTRSLWLAVGVHLGWNLATASVLGLPVSGLHLPSLLRWRVADTPLSHNLLGGAFGPEEGLAFHVCITLTLGLLLALGRRWGPEEG